jgi:ABC-type transport system involved in multi-copper enzyme maturation permease subunit
MTAQTAAIVPITTSAGRAGMFLGFGTVLRKEITEWLRSPKALIVVAVSTAGAILSTLAPIIERAMLEPGQIPELGMDPTTNVLLGWGGESVALIAVVATMALISGERDRGTLAWSLTNPVSPTSILGAKFLAALLVFSAAAVIVPIAISIGLATVVYGAVPDLLFIGQFVALFLMLPVFYIALTVASATAISSTAGVAGVAFAVMFVPQILGGFRPDLVALLPTSIGRWVVAFVAGEPVPLVTPISWLVSMVVLAVGAKLIFDRREF